MGTSTILCYNFSSPSVLGIKLCKGSSSHQAVGILEKKAEARFSRPYSGLGCPRTSDCSTAAPPSERRSKLDDFVVRSNPQPESFLPLLHPPPDSWLISLLLGLIAMVPFITQRLLTFTKEADTTTETLEKIADFVEQVSEDVEKVAEEIAEKLPEGGKLRNVANFVENVAKETAKDAQLIQDFIDKVEEFNEDIESVIRGDHSEKSVKAANEESKEINLM